MPDTPALVASARKDLRAFKGDQKEKAKEASMSLIPAYFKLAFSVGAVDPKHALIGAGIGAGLGGLRSMTQDPEHRHTGANILGGAALGAAGGAGYSALRGNLPKAIGGTASQGELMAPAGQTIPGVIPGSAGSRGRAEMESMLRQESNAGLDVKGAPQVGTSVLPEGFAPSTDGKWLIHEVTGKAVPNTVLSAADVAAYHKHSEAKFAFWATEYSKLAQKG